MTADLATVWFVLVGVLLTGYAVLDGFDLGVGALHLFAKTDDERRTLLNSIGPVWDGNEVWLLAGGGALFAAFPRAYATLLSGFYAPVMLLLLALILRAVSIEFRGKRPAPGWRRAWDGVFSGSSVLAAFLLGVSLGNVAMGVPLGSDGEFAGSLGTLLNPFALLLGATTVSLCALHGGAYVLRKTEGDLLRRAQSWSQGAFIAFVLCSAAAHAAAFSAAPRVVAPFLARPGLSLLPVLHWLAIAWTARELLRGEGGRAFSGTTAVVATFTALFGLSLFPDLLPSAAGPEYSLTIRNAASSPRTLRVMLIIAAAGMPLVIGYTAFVYWVFRGKVRLDSSSY